MSFSQTLGSLVARIEGCSGALIAGIDGILIDRFVRAETASLDLESIATEFSTLLRRSLSTSSDTELGLLQEIVLSTDDYRFLLRPITPEYFLLLVLDSSGNVGRGRFELRKTQLDLEIEFAV